MAVSTKKRNIIIAEWKTGIYKSKNALAKEYKLDPKTIVRILKGIMQDNALLVESAVIVENAKKTLKNPMEITAVEKAVKTLTESESLIKNLTVKALKGIEKILDKGELKKPTKMKIGDIDKIEQVVYELTPIDYKNCIEGIDKASVTIGVNQRHANGMTLNAEQIGVNYYSPEKNKDN